MVNILNCGGGGFVGTSYMLGSVLALDQVLVVPGCHETKSFFDYAEDANVSFGDLEFRVDDVLSVMPESVRSGDDDRVSKVFSVAQGISGGSLLAWGVLSGAPLAYLTKSMLEFDARTYLKINTKELSEFFKSLPAVGINVAAKTVGRVLEYAGKLVTDNGWKKMRFSLLSDCLLDAFHAVKVQLPDGLCDGAGIENYVSGLSSKYPSLKTSFADFEKVQRRLVVIAERLNYVQLVNEVPLHETEVYFGIPPYTDTPVTKAIRASCSIPGLISPLDWYDAELRRYFQLCDGAVAKTVGFRKLRELYPDAGVQVVLNPIVPQEKKFGNLVDTGEQFLKKLIYDRKCALWDTLDERTKESTVVFEADKNFDHGLMAWPDMKLALWRGYRDGLEFLLRNYTPIYERFSNASLDMVSPSVLLDFVEKNRYRKPLYEGLVSV